MALLEEGREAKTEAQREGSQTSRVSKEIVHTLGRGLHQIKQTLKVEAVKVELEIQISTSEVSEESRQVGNTLLI